MKQTLKRIGSYFVPSVWILVLIMGLLLYFPESNQLFWLEADGGWKIIWQVFTNVFVHASLGHFANNMVFLLVAGMFLQMIPVRYFDAIKIFMVSAVGASVVWLLLMMFIDGHEKLLGASGGIYGLYGACWIILSQLCLRRVKYTDDPVFGEYGHYGWKWIFVTVLLLLMVVQTLEVPNNFQVVVHIVGLVIGLIYGQVLFYIIYDKDLLQQERKHGATRRNDPDEYE